MNVRTGELDRAFPTFINGLAPKPEYMTRASTPAVAAFEDRMRSVSQRTPVVMASATASAA